MTKEDIELLKILIETKGFYRIRISTAQNVYTMAAAKACDIVASNFEDEILLHLDSLGNIVDIDYILHSSCVEDNRDYLKKLNESHSEWKTRVTFQTPFEPSGVVLEIINSEQENKEKQEQEKGFFAKYWYFFVPLVVMVVLNTIAGAIQLPEEGTGNRAGQVARTRRPPTQS